jgi:hypothetical protein
MIVYRDKAWCTRSHTCSNANCYRNYTEAERDRNNNGVNLPLSMADFKKDGCGFIPEFLLTPAMCGLKHLNRDNGRYNAV